MTPEQINAAAVIIKAESNPVVHDLVDAICRCLADVSEARNLWAVDNTRWSRRADDFPDNVRRIGVSR